mgnify:CR=1 FL=1
MSKAIYHQKLSFEVKMISFSNREISYIALIDTIFTPMGFKGVVKFS